jgi:hypothetical protein
MHRLKVVCLALVAVFAVGAVVASSAFAEARLPEFTRGGKSTVTVGEGEFTSSVAAIKCRTMSGSLETESGTRRLGPFTFDFKTCTATVLGERLGCKSLGDTYINAARPTEGGTILVNGSWHLVPGRRQTPAALVLLLVKEVHLECSNERLTITALVLVRGSVLGAISPLARSTKKFTINVETTAKGGTTQKTTEFENDREEAVTARLESSTDSATAFEATGVNSSAITLEGEEQEITG